MSLAKPFRSFTLRLTLRFCGAYGVGVGFLMVLMAIHVAPVIRHDYEHRAEAALRTTLAQMTPDDRDALRRVEAPSADGLNMLARSVQANSFEGLIFWRRDKPGIIVGHAGDEAALTGWWRLVARRSSAWSGGTVTIRTAQGAALLAMEHPDRRGEAVTFVMPYEIIRRHIGKVMETFIFPPLIALAVGLLLGYWPLRYLNRHLRTISHVAAQVASGKLHTPVPKVKYQDNMGLLYREIAQMQTNLGGLVKNLRDASREVEESAVSLDRAAKEATRSSHQVAATMNEMSHGVMELAGNIRFATEAVTEMAAQIDVANRAAEAVTGLSEETLSSTETGREMVRTAVDEVTSLTGHVQNLADIIMELRSISAEIGEVVTFIGGVAEQTNLLALNASIEAAHAGEYGATFSILAERIQGLSADAGKAGAKIGQHIKQILDGIGRVDQVVGGSVGAFVGAAEQVTQAGELFIQIAEMVKEIAAQSENVARSAAALYRQGEETNERMQNIAAFSQEMAASVEEAAAAAQEQAAASEQVGRTADELARLANGFREVTSTFEI
ncbi:MAG: methyl-accepting chemotaxis protein [Bacteroidota bacterium]